MKKETNYKAMYQELLLSSEKAIQALTDCMKNGLPESITAARQILIEAQRVGEEIYIDTSDDNLLFLDSTGNTANQRTT